MVLTVSDSRTRRDDTSGATIVESLKKNGHRVVDYEIVPDSIDAIRGAFETARDSNEVDVTIITGGTGIAARDVTIEAVKPLLTRELPGFGETFRSLSFADIGAHALLSRAFAGTSAHMLVFALPGSPKACELAMEKLVLPLLAHGITLLR